MQKYVDTPSNEWIWLFHPHQLLTGVYEIEHTALQTPCKLHANSIEKTLAVE
jgi:hypothetical protein